MDKKTLRIFLQQMMKRTQGSNLPRVIRPSSGAGLEFWQFEGAQGSAGSQGGEFMDSGLHEQALSQKNNLIAYI